MSSDPRREKNRNPTKHQQRDLARTTAQNLWDRCHPLSRMSEGKDVQDRTTASSPMQQPLAAQMNPMNQIATNRPPSCENDFLFRYGSLLPKTTTPPPFRSSIDLFIKRLAPVAIQVLHKRTNSAPHPPARR